MPVTINEVVPRTLTDREARLLLRKKLGFGIKRGSYVTLTRSDHFNATSSCGFEVGQDYLVATVDTSRSLVTIARLTDDGTPVLCQVSAANVDKVVKAASQ